MVKACICGPSALELYRASGRLLPDVMANKRTAKLAECGVPAAAILKGDMLRLGVKQGPFHLLLAKEAGGRKRDDIVCHRLPSVIAPRSIIELSKEYLVSGPELTFLGLAALAAYDEVDLALIGYELCGTYVLDASWDGLTNTQSPMTSRASIARVLAHQSGCSGVVKARKALELVRDGSNSPMETVLCALLTFPRHLGGYALGSVSLNYQVSTGHGTRYIDLAFPACKVGLEYKGKEYHSVERAGRDDRRQNEITGSGWTILNVWYEDLVEEHLFDRLIQELARAMGIRIRIRSEGFAARRALLRARLMPAVMKFGDGSGTGA